MASGVAVIGVGEAGGAIAADLVAAGVEVSGFDPRGADVPGMRSAASLRAAVQGADLILVLVTASAAVRVMADGLPYTGPDAVWADLNTGSPRLKRELAETAACHRRSFVDVALLAPVPGRGLRTPSLAAGTGASEYARRLEPFGVPVTLVDGPAGAAAERKLLRSVFMKGIAAAVLESLAAARAAGCEDWMRENLVGQLGADLVHRLETGSHTHAARRAHEVEAAGDLLGELGVPARVTKAAHGWLTELADAEGAQDAR